MARLQTSDSLCYQRMIAIHLTDLGGSNPSLGGLIAFLLTEFLRPTKEQTAKFMLHRQFLDFDDRIIWDLDFLVNGCFVILHLGFGAQLLSYSFISTFGGCCLEW